MVDDFISVQHPCENYHIFQILTENINVMKVCSSTDLGQQ